MAERKNNTQPFSSSSPISTPSSSGSSQNVSPQEEVSIKDSNPLSIVVKEEAASVEDDRPDLLKSQQESLTQSSNYLVAPALSYNSSMPRLPETAVKDNMWKQPPYENAGVSISASPTGYQTSIATLKGILQDSLPEYRYRITKSYFNHGGETWKKEVYHEDMSIIFSLVPNVTNDSTSKIQTIVIIKNRDRTCQHIALIAVSLTDPSVRHVIGRKQDECCFKPDEDSICSLMDLVVHDKVKRSRGKEFILEVKLHMNRIPQVSVEDYDNITTAES